MAKIWITVTDDVSPAIVDLGIVEWCREFGHEYAVTEVHCPNGYMELVLEPKEAEGTA